jgi:hypothetical protein
MSEVGGWAIAPVNQTWSREFFGVPRQLRLGAAIARPSHNKFVR